MAPPQAETVYKKKPGVLAISKDRKSVSWSPAQPPDAAPSFVVSAGSVVNLQQTPEASAKVMLKIFTQDPGQTESVPHVFTFTSTIDPRKEANAIKEALSSVIQAQKAAQTAAAAAASTTGQSAAMTIANAIAGGAKVGNMWEDDNQLKANIDLQQSLLKVDEELQRTFVEAAKSSLNPYPIHNSPRSSGHPRVHLLRAHAIGQSQGRGRYNVFSDLRREDGGRKMNLTQDHIRTIFEQYPMMRRVYDEVVPRKCKDEVEFWSRFFQSQLYKALRGEKFDRRTEEADKILDKYLDDPELTGLRLTSTELHIPKFLDLEGNEENHSQRQGNRPDAELRSSNLDRAPVIRKLNALSEKLMASVRPSDVDASAPIGMDEATYESLRLRDLAGDPEQNRIILNIRDQSRFFSDSRPSASIDSNPFNTIDPAKAVQNVVNDISTHFSRPGEGIIPIDPFEEYVEDEENDDVEEDISGSTIATNHITALVKAHRDQTSEIQNTSGLPDVIYDRVKLTHSTTIEFLRQFWNAFLSGDGGRANEVASLVESLTRALDRINAIADDAEAERRKHIKGVERSIEERFRKTGRRPQMNPETVPAGGEVVKQLLSPLMGSLGVAVEKYKVAFEEQSREAGDEG